MQRHALESNHRVALLHGAYSLHLRDEARRNFSKHAQSLLTAKLNAIISIPS
jgi:hypothetical protein